MKNMISLNIKIVFNVILCSVIGVVCGVAVFLWADRLTSLLPFTLAERFQEHLACGGMVSLVMAALLFGAAGTVAGIIWNKKMVMNTTVVIALFAVVAAGSVKAAEKLYGNGYDCLKRAESAGSYMDAADSVKECGFEYLMIAQGMGYTSEYILNAYDIPIKTAKMLSFRACDSDLTTIKAVKKGEVYRINSRKAFGHDEKGLFLDYIGKNEN